MQPRLTGKKTCLSWRHFLTFSVSGTKSVSSLIWNRLLSIWHSFIMLRLDLVKDSAGLCIKCSAVLGNQVRKANNANIKSLFVHKSCTIVKVFWGHKILLCKETCENKSLLINNLSHVLSQSVWKGIKVVGALLPLEFLSDGISR